jgi:hypothetical protein
LRYVEIDALQGAEDKVVIGDMVIDVKALSVSVKDRSVELTPKEDGLLCLFITHLGHAAQPGVHQDVALEGLPDLPGAGSSISLYTASPPEDRKKSPGTRSYCYRPWCRL